MSASGCARENDGGCKDFSILDYRVNMRLDNLPVAEIAKFYYEVTREGRGGKREEGAGD